MVANGENGEPVVVHGKLYSQLLILARLIFFQGIKVISFILGFFLTFGLLTAFYGDLALTKLFKGISIQNFIEIIEEVNISELAVIFYFIGLFIFFYILNRSMNEYRLFSPLSPLQRSTIFGIIVYFREGIFTLPFIIMIVFPLLLQIILPLLIIFVAFIELIFPLVIMGELYSISKRNIQKISQSRGKILKKIGGILLAYPLGVFILVTSGLDKFLNLLHFHFLWNNPDSWIAPALWSSLNQLIEFISFGSNDILSVLSNSKYYVVTFVILVITSEIYLIVKKFVKIHLSPRLEGLILTYD